MPVDVTLDLERPFNRRSGPDAHADACRSRNARLPRDKAAPLEHLHHLVDARRRNEEVPLDVRLGGRSSEKLDVPGNEGEIL